MSKFVIFHCYGGAHSSVTSAGIYLGLLPRDRLPTNEEILMVPHYDGNEPIIYGHFRFMGRDPADRAVFVLGKGMLGPHINRLLINVAGIYGRACNIFSVDTTAPVNLFMAIGGFISRALKIVWLGRPIVVLGTKISYFRFVKLVNIAEKRLWENCRTGEAPLPSRRCRAVFYVCPEGCRHSLLAAGLHVRPEASYDEMLCWARQQSFTGALGSVLHAGTADECQVYIVGAGREPLIVGRIIRELRTLLGVPQSDLMVLDSGMKTSFLGCLAAKVCRWIGLTGLYRSWEERLFKKMMHTCRRKRDIVIKRIKEGILD